MRGSLTSTPNIVSASSVIGYSQTVFLPDIAYVAAPRGSVGLSEHGAISAGMQVRDAVAALVEQAAVRVVGEVAGS